MTKRQPIAAIYARISKEDLDKAHKGDDSESIQNQKLLLIDYAVSNGFLIHNVYVDEDLGGFSERPAFERMIKDAQGGIFDTIICKSQSRFTRDMEMVERYIHGHFVEWGIRFISLTDNVDTNVKGNKKARQIYGLVNEWFSEDLSENIRAVFRKKMEAGQFLGAFACYGYMKDPRDRHKLIIDDEAAKVVKEIFYLYLEGHGTHSIAHILSERGVSTPGLHKRNSGLNFANPNGGRYSMKYGIWAASTVNRILKNEAYIGTLIQGSQRKVSYKSKKVAIAPESEWVVIKNSHAPIIDEATFYKVRKLMERKRRGYGNAHGKKPDTAKPHLLAGKLLCAGCGSGMQRSGASRDGKTHYLRCRLSAKSKRGECTPRCVSQEKIEEAILEKIRGFIQNVLGDDADCIVNTALAQIGKDSGTRGKIEKQLTEYDRKIEVIKTNIAMAYAEKLKGIIAEADFLNFKEVFEKERQSHINKKRLLKEELASMDMGRRTFGDVKALLEGYMQLDVLTHEIINDFVDTIHIGEKNRETGEQVVVVDWLF